MAFSGANPWKDKTVAVLGASGFIGTHVVQRLVPQCRRVIAFARGTATGALEALAGASVVLGDVRSAADVQGAIDGTDIVFHLAGSSGSVQSTGRAADDLQTNVGGLLNTLEAARRQSTPPRIVFPGSRLEYGRVRANPVAETAPLEPTSPYGLHKAFCERYLEFAARAYGVSYAVGRLTNPYGPHIQRHHSGYNVLNQMIARARAADMLTVYGEGRQLRDYIFIDDAVDALLLLAARSENVVVNIGSGTGTAFRTAAETIVRLARSGSVQSVPWPAAESSVETGDFVADISAIARLGWKPRYSFEAGITETLSRLGTRPN